MCTFISKMVFNGDFKSSASYLRRRANGTNIARVSTATKATTLDHNRMAGGQLQASTEHTVLCVDLLAKFIPRHRERVIQCSKIKATAREKNREGKKLKMKNGCRRFAVIIVIFPTISERQVFLQTSRTDLLSSDRSSRFRPNISHVERAERREFLLDLVHWKLKKKNIQFFFADQSRKYYKSNRQIGFALSLCYCSQTNKLGARAS